MAFVSPNEATLPAAIRTEGWWCGVEAIVKVEVDVGYLEGGGAFWADLLHVFILLFSENLRKN